MYLHKYSGVKRKWRRDWEKLFIVYFQFDHFSAIVGGNFAVGALHVHAARESVRSQSLNNASHLPRTSRNGFVDDQDEIPNGKRIARLRPLMALLKKRHIVAEEDASTRTHAGLRLLPRASKDVGRMERIVRNDNGRRVGERSRVKDVCRRQGFGVVCR